jgi:hypothetical protein
VRAVVPALRRSPSVELSIRLDGVAARIAESGTRAEQGVLHAMSEVAASVAPGAAAAIVDWPGAEVARLRAFGRLHGLIIERLGEVEHAWLLDRIAGDDGARDVDLVA